MKYLLIILAFLTLPLHAQKKSEPWKVLGLYSTQIVLNAVGDGLNDSGHKQLGHAFNAASIGTALATPFILNVDKRNWGGYFASYALIRFSMFDYTYNMTRGLPLDYVGNSATSDKFLQLTKPPSGTVLFMKSLTMTVGVTVVFNYCKGSKVKAKNIYY